MHSLILVTFLLSLQRVCHATFHITGQIILCCRGPVQPETFNSVLDFYPLDARNILGHSVQNVFSHRHIYPGGEISPTGKALCRVSFHCYHCLSNLATGRCWVKPLETLGTKVYPHPSLQTCCPHSDSQSSSFPQYGLGLPREKGPSHDKRSKRKADIKGEKREVTTTKGEDSPRDKSIGSNRRQRLVGRDKRKGRDFSRSRT